MAEKKTSIILVDAVYLCDSGDGGTLSYGGPPSKDAQSQDVFPHACSNPKDKTIYYLKQKYPRVDSQAVNADLIPGFKLP